MATQPPRGAFDVAGNELNEAATLAIESLRAQPARSALAIVGIVIGIVTVVLVASTLVGLRNSVALLFRELGTDNIFAYHYSGEPYSAPTELDVQRPQLRAEYAPVIEKLGPAIRDVGIELIVPAVTSTRTLTARAGNNESDTVLIEGISPNFYDIVGAEFVGGRPFTDTEERVRAQVAVLGASVARALFGQGSSVGQSFLLGGDRYYVIGELAPRKGTFFGENRNDSVVAIPVNTARLKFPDARNMVLYIRARPGMREEARAEAADDPAAAAPRAAGRRGQLRDEHRGPDHRAVRSHRHPDLHRDDRAALR